MLLIGRNEFSTWAAMWSDIPWGYMLISVITSAPAAARSAPLTPLNRINKLDSRAKRHFRKNFFRFRHATTAATSGRLNLPSAWFEYFAINLNKLLNWTVAFMCRSYANDCWFTWRLKWICWNEFESKWWEDFWKRRHLLLEQRNIFLVEDRKNRKTAGVRCWAASSLFL